MLRRDAKSNGEVPIDIQNGKVVTAAEYKATGLSEAEIQTIIRAWLERRSRNAAPRYLWGDKLTDKIQNLGLVIGEQFCEDDKVVARYRWDYDLIKGVHVNIEIFGREAKKYVLVLESQNENIVFAQYVRMTEEALKAGVIDISAPQADAYFASRRFCKS